MSDYFITQILTLVLAAYGLFYTNQPYYLLCIAGLLLVINTIQNLSDETDIIVVLLKSILMFLFCAISHGFLIFLIWTEAGYRRGVSEKKCEKRFERIGIRFKIRFLLPEVLFIAWQIAACTNMANFDGNFAADFDNGQGIKEILPVIVMKFLLLSIGSLMIWYIRKILTYYIDYKKKISVSIQQLALDELKEKKISQRLLIQSNIAERNARLEERENISRNIHNSVGHTITAAGMALDAAEILWDTDSGRAFDKMVTANERIHAGLESIRHAVRVLDAEAENISLEDFILEIDAIIENFTIDADVKVQFDKEILSNEIQIPHEHTELLTGAVEELFTNGIKHGQAESFVLYLLADSHHIKIVVKDHGKSDFNSENAAVRIQNGFGIKKIIRYVKKNGGVVELKNENGFRAEIVLNIET